MKFDLEKVATEYAERLCNGQFPIEYEKEQVVRHTKDDFIVGANEYKHHVLSVLKENYDTCKTLTDEDKVRSAQETVNETYEDLLAIFGG